MTTATLHIWKMTIITIPMSVILLFMAVLSTGAGHGTGAMLYFFYAPLSWFGGAFIFGPLLHMAYAICADRVRVGSLRISYFWGAMAFHYLSFAFFVLCTSVGERSVSKDLLLTVFAQNKMAVIVFLSFFFLWQIALIRAVLTRA